MKYTAEEVRKSANWLYQWERKAGARNARAMLIAFAERIEADEGAVPFGYAYRYADGIKLGGSGRERNGMRPTETIPLFAHPPAQAEPTEAVISKAVEVFLSVAPEWNDYSVKDGMRAALRTVWPNPPAQAAQSVDVAKVREVIAYLKKGHRFDAEMADKLTAALPESKP